MCRGWSSVFFFFNQKTAYEMRISDWSSDVCSSDLLAQNNDNPVYYVQYAHARICSVLAAWGGDAAALAGVDLAPLQSPVAQALLLLLATIRSGSCRERVCQYV